MNLEKQNFTNCWGYQEYGNGVNYNDCDKLSNTIK